MKTIDIRPLTREAFAPFGDVLETEGAHNFPINAGKCVRYHDLAKIETTGEKARPMISLLRGEPYPLPLELTMVERHPFGSQAFIPLSEHPFLVVVAEETSDGPGDRLQDGTRTGRQYRPQCLARHPDAA
jgi:ureidoglycolate lyase